MAVSQGDARTQTPGTTSFGTLVEWRGRTRLFDLLVAYRDWGLPMTGAGEAELVRGLRVSAGFFDTLDVPMQLGRNFTEQEDHPNTSRVLILSDGFWKTRFGGNCAVIGQSVTLSPARRQLLELIRRYNFCVIENLEVRGGEPVLDPPPRVTQEIKIGTDNDPRLEIKNDFLLQGQIIELLHHLDCVGDGRIAVIEVRHRLPFRLVVERSA
jgi:hypothetical protein